MTKSDLAQLIEEATSSDAPEEVPAEPDTTTSYYSMYRNSCTAKTSSGRTCHAVGLRGRSYCFFHAPEKTADRREAQSAGGSAHRRTVLDDFAQLGISLVSPGGIQAAIEHVFRLQLLGAISERQAAGLCRVLRLAHSNERRVTDTWFARQEAYYDQRDKLVGASDLIIDRLERREARDDARAARLANPPAETADLQPQDEPSELPDNVRFLHAW